MKNSLIIILILALFFAGCATFVNSGKSEKPAAGPEWEEVYTGTLSVDRINDSINTVLAGYILKNRAGSAAVSIKDNKNSDKVYELVRGDPDILRITFRINSDPVSLEIKADVQRKTGDGWVPGQLNAKEMNIFEDIIEQINFKLWQPAEE